MEMVLLKDRIEDIIRDNDPSVAAMVMLAALQECAKADKAHTTAPAYRVIDKAIDSACESMFG
jgi:hypothetical protein